MRRVIAGVLVISLGLLLKSCNTTEPPPSDTLTLKLEDVSCTEAWIELTTTNLQLPATITLKQNNQVRSAISLVKTDTLLYIDSLLPNQSYSFQATIQPYNNTSEVKSNLLNVTTLDTTSHNFTFETWTFGEHSSSVLYDVAIIDENNIWAVGEIFMNDSLGQPDPHPYGLAHWNGTDWMLMKVPYHDFNQTEKYPGPLFSIAIIEGEIYVVSYANLLKWTGNDWEEKAFFMEQIPFDGQVIKIWGYSENNIYCVGRNGAIYYYFGTGWQKLESGTDLNIYDIWGDYNNESGEYEIIAVSANRGVSFDKSIIKINETGTVTPLPTSGIPYSIHVIWFKGMTYYIVGSGMYKKKNINSVLNWEAIHQGVSDYYIDAIRGNGLNDIMACGAFGELLHFNGVDWKSYQETFSGILLGRVAIKDNLIITVGIDNPKAFIAIGTRQ